MNIGLVELLEMNPTVVSRRTYVTSWMNSSDRGRLETHKILT